MTAPTCLNADATQAAAWEQVMAGRKAHALITDPPYCLLTRRRKGGDLRDPKGKKNDTSDVVQRFESVRDYRAFTEAWLKHAAAHVDGPFVVWSNLLGKEPIIAAAKALGWSHLWGEFTWAKRTRPSNSGEELLRVVEVAVVMSRTPRPLEKNDDAALPWAVVAGYDDDGQAARFGNHPNHKPFGVLEPLIRTYSRPGDLVVDPFAGSGSIPAAALALGRQTACIERDPSWAARVTSRLSSIEPSPRSHSR